MSRPVALSPRFVRDSLRQGCRLRLQTYLLREERGTKPCPLNEEASEDSRRADKRRIPLCHPSFAASFISPVIPLRVAQDLEDIARCKGSAAAPLVYDAPRCRLAKLQDRAPQRRFAAPGFPDEPEGLPRADLQCDILVGSQVLRSPPEEPRPVERIILFKIRDG